MVDPFEARNQERLTENGRVWYWPRIIRAADEHGVFNPLEIILNVGMLRSEFNAFLKMEVRNGKLEKRRISGIDYYRVLP